MTHLCTKCQGTGVITEKETMFMRMFPVVHYITSMCPKKGSKNRKKAIRKVADLHRRITNIRINSAHQCTTSLTWADSQSPNALPHHNRLNHRLHARHKQPV